MCINIPKLSLFHFNARSLLPKMPELRTVINSHKPDIIAVTETWLTNAIPDGAIYLHDYNTLARADRQTVYQRNQHNSQRGGGVLLLAHDSLRVTLRPDLRVWPESTWIEVDLSNNHSNRSLIVGCMYRPPASDAQSFAQDLEASLEKINLQRSDVTIIGDFNAKSPSWNPTDSSNAAGRILEPIFLQLGLHQCVTSPTHVLPDGRLGAILDLVLTSNPHLVSSVSTQPPLGTSDHLSLLCKLDLTIARRRPTFSKTIWSYEKADFIELNKVLSNTDWSNAYFAEDVDLALSSWTSTFMSIVNKHIPSKVIKNIKPKNPFVTPVIEAAIKEKRAALRALKKEPTTAHREAFKQSRNRVTHLLRKSERAHATSLYRSKKLHPCSSTSKSFWQHMRVLQGKVKQTAIPDLIKKTTGTIAHTANDKAELLNEFFCQQTVLPGALSATPDVSGLKQNSRTFNTLRTTPGEVFDVLSHLKTDKSAGIDGLSPRLLQHCAAGIAESLAIIFNYSFTSASFPTLWKRALVTPIFKKGDKKLPGNYRPISLLPVLSKVLERIVHNKLSRFLSPWLNDNQSGFKRFDGTTSQLTRLTQEWCNHVDSGQYVGTVFFDLQKAFDRVWYQGLLAKLDAAGIKGAAHRWLTSFLTGRQQATVVDGVTSPFAALYAGVPQGAVLSPLLFSVYVNDIPFSASTNLFADDTSSYVVDASPSGLRDKLQQRTDNLCMWFQKWLLTVNPTKSAVMAFRPLRKPRVQLQIVASTAIIPQQHVHPHLGIVFNETLTWSDHVDKVISSASAKLGLLRRMNKQLDSIVLRELYLYCILPAIEYGHVVWAGLTASDAKRLEKLNRNAARVIQKISAASDLPKNVLLARAGLSTLSERRKTAQVLFCLKINRQSPHLPHHLRTAVNFWTSTPSTHTMSLRGDSVRLPRPWTNCQRNSPLYSAFSVWNSLPKTLQSSPTIASIKQFFS